MHNEHYGPHTADWLMLGILGSELVLMSRYILSSATQECNTGKDKEEGDWGKAKLSALHPCQRLRLSARFPPETLGAWRR